MSEPNVILEKLYILERYFLTFVCLCVRWLTGGMTFFLKYHARGLTYFEDILPENTLCKQCLNWGERDAGKLSTLFFQKL